MSNAMRMGKRTLAGVAAGALALGALTIASAPAASAKPNVKPKASKVATVGAVRATGVSSPLSLPAASMTWGSGAGTLSTISTVDLITAPTNTARLYVVKATDGLTGSNFNYATLIDDTVSTLGVAAGAYNKFYTADDSYMLFRVDTAGAYTGQIYNGVDTATFSFTTGTAPTSMVLEPATQTVLVGAQADLSLTLKDSTGRATQPQIGDNVSLTSSTSDDTLSVIDDSSAIITQLTSTAPTVGNLSTGVGYFSLNTNQTAGSTTVTATPFGTLPGSGVTTQTATVVKSGTVSSTAVAKMSVTAPTNAWNLAYTGTSWATANRQSQIPEGSTAVTVTIDDTTAAAAGNKIRVAVQASAGTVDGVSYALGPNYYDLTTDASKKATVSFTLGGLAVTNGQYVTVTQVNVRDQNVFFGSDAVTQKITVKTPAVNGSTTTVSPTQVVTKIGTVTPITVTVDDSFGTKQPNVVVGIYRGSAVSGGTFLGQATTNSSGVATLNAVNAASVTTTTTEAYSFQLTLPGGSTQAKDNAVSITYTPTGDIASISVAVSSGTTPLTTSAPTVTTAPLLLVPDDTAAVPYGTSAGTFTVATGAAGTAANGNLATFTATTTPSNSVTVTVPEGLYVSKTAPTAWNGGTQTVTVASGTAVYVWGTKVGVHDVVVSSGGLQVTGKVKLANRAQDAYNIALTPAKADIQKGSFADLTVKVTDYWGNPVVSNADAVRVSATGAVLLGGLNNTTTVTTDANGEARVVVIAQGDLGTGTVTATPNASAATATPAWVATYTKPTTFTSAPTTSAASVITVTSSTSKTITITDSGRTTVSGKPGVYANGSTTGFTEGDTLKVWVKFPGQTEYTEGSAKPAIAADGTFEWERKTGKKTYVYFSNNDGLVKSSSVIIPAK